MKHREKVGQRPRNLNTLKSCFIFRTQIQNLKLILFVEHLERDLCCFELETRSIFNTKIETLLYF